MMTWISVVGTVRNGQFELKMLAFIHFLRILWMDIWRFALGFGVTWSLDGSLTARKLRVGWSLGMIWSSVCDTFPAFADDLVPHFFITGTAHTLHLNEMKSFNFCSLLC